MSNKTILQINSSGRFDGSVTRQLSKLVVEQLAKRQPKLTLTTRELATGLPFIDEQWIGANFTAPEQRSERQLEALSFSDQLVSELQLADHIVIASPIYNYSIPAVLKAWIDLVARAQLTFRYTENGPEGLLKDKKAYVVVASGGVTVGSEMDHASRYLKQVLGFIGITDVTIIDASTINLADDDNNDPAEQQIEALTQA
ncbi:MAG: FMN-dependent NADH-azoreductase [Enterobacterales bacterium]|jgi:FMN-dependent NADH-azoreductase